MAKQNLTLTESLLINRIIYLFQERSPYLIFIQDNEIISKFTPLQNDVNEFRTRFIDHFLSWLLINLLPFWDDANKDKAPLFFKVCIEKNELLRFSLYQQYTDAPLEPIILSLIERDLLTRLLYFCQRIQKITVHDLLIHLF